MSHDKVIAFSYGYVYCLTDFFAFTPINESHPFSKKCIVKKERLDILVVRTNVKWI
ncbi:hypothetical protein [Gracilibacillus boraciitolerans]|uniref:hypothetical protein n=1 Tax=Gracilibacillus boraciitolerans TaxID=307521 RepID=UPI001F4879F8|nr:hypothetical protein [Gracilibacillus boraciitolerans]